MTKQERLEKMKADLIRMTRIEKDLYANGFNGRRIRLIAGIDEVGRGPLAGPVVTAAVILPEDFSLLGVNDSKKLSEKRREALFDEIMSCAAAVSIGMRGPEVIDRINILNATKEAMADAVIGLDPQPDILLIDAVEIPDMNIPQQSIIKGDEKSVSIAAASIIAKVTRDRLMKLCAEKYPGYAFEKNKGYGTREHYAGIDANGISPIHRRSFLTKYFSQRTAAEIMDMKKK